MPLLSSCTLSTMLEHKTACFVLKWGSLLFRYTNLDIKQCWKRDERMEQQHSRWISVVYLHFLISFTAFTILSMIHTINISFGEHIISVLALGTMHIIRRQVHHHSSDIVGGIISMHLVSCTKVLLLWHTTPETKLTECISWLSLFFSFWKAELTILKSIKLRNDCSLKMYDGCVANRILVRFPLYSLLFTFLESWKVSCPREGHHRFASSCTIEDPLPISCIGGAYHTVTLASRNTYRSKSWWAQVLNLRKPANEVKVAYSHICSSLGS